MRTFGANEYTSVEYHLAKTDATAKSIDTGPLWTKDPLPRWTVGALPIDRHRHQQ